jgi:hypothetical protein
MRTRDRSCQDPVWLKRRVPSGPRRLLRRLVLIAAVGVSFASWPMVAVGKPTPRATTALSYRSCQPPGVLPGIVVFDRHHISGARACRVALEFEKWYDRGRHARALYYCRGFHAHLRVRRWDGWHLAFNSTSGFSMARNGVSFGVAGQDFPVDCA